MRLVVLVGTLAACGFTPTTANGTHPNDAAAGSEPGPIVVDTRPIDGPPDAPKTWQVIDTLTVPCTQTPVMSTVTLTSTGTYHLRASSECTVNTGNNSMSDAEYFGYNVNQFADIQSGVDNGIAIDDTAPSPNKTRWGTYNDTDHTYEIPFTGKDAVITAEYWDSNYPNNAGGLKLEILEYK